MTNIDLSGLRDIHIPSEPPLFPLATGWYILFSIILILIISIICLYNLYKKTPIQYALKELKKIKSITPDKQLKTLSQLLKRVAMAKYGRKDIAMLSEESWETFLLSSAPMIFTKKQAHELAFAIYETKSTLDKNLFCNAKTWIKKILKSKNNTL